MPLTPRMGVPNEAVIGIAPLAHLRYRGGMKYQLYQLKLEQLVSYFQSGAINLAPAFQRGNVLSLHASLPLKGFAFNGGYPAKVIMVSMACRYSRYEDPGIVASMIRLSIAALTSSVVTNRRSPPGTRSIVCFAATMLIRSSSRRRDRSASTIIPWWPTLAACRARLR